MSLGAGGLRKARFTCQETGEQLAVHLNPVELTIAKGTTVSQPFQPAAAAGATPVFVNTHTRTLTAELTLDAWSSKRDVAADAAMIQTWLNPTARSLRANVPQPAVVQLEWNQATTFPGYLKKADVTYSLFAAGGAPLRAKVRIELVELPETPPRTNPTSGGEPGSRTRIVRQGDTLQSLAWAEYRDTRLWRALAIANGVADPLRIEAGTRFSIPPLARARELAA